MMHLTFSEQSLLLDDTVARLAVRYAAELASRGLADSLTLRAYGADGDKVEAVLLLDQGTTLMAETSHTDLPEPDNSEAIDYLEQKLAALTTAQEAGAVDDAQDYLAPAIDL